MPPAFHLYFLLTGVQSQGAKASSSCCFDDFTFRVVSVYEFTARLLWNWDVFLDLGFRSFALHKASPRIPSQLEMRELGIGVIPLLSLKRCNDYGNDFSSFCTGGSVAAVGLALCIRLVLRYREMVTGEHGGSRG